MVEDNSNALDRVFHALADATRRKILTRISKSSCTVTELATPFAMSLAAVSKHIKVLENAGLLTRSVDGRIHRCTMNGAPLVEASELIRHYQQFWESRFDAIEQFLSEAKLHESSEAKLHEEDQEGKKK